jgi:hypothetical protein
MARPALCGVSAIATIFGDMRLPRQIAEGPMMKRLGPLFWGEAILAFLTLSLGVLTIFWDDWIEGIFGFDPDQGDGSFEKELVVGLFVLTALLSALAGRSWRKAEKAALASS